MTATTCRRCRGQEADDSGAPCARCDGYGIEPALPYEEWAAAKASQARREADTFTRTHWDGCHLTHLDCANRRIKDLQAEITKLHAEKFDALGQPGPRGPA